MSKKTEGGININNARDLNVSGDIIGRDKSENIYVDVPQEEKGGCAYVIEKTTIFIFFWFVGSFVLAIFAGGITALIFYMVFGSNNIITGAIVGAGLGILLALGIAITGASNVKRHK